MAIPFAFPNDEDIENNYQRLDQLLADLFDVLQQILVTQRHIRDAQPTAAARNRTGQLSSGRRTNDGPEPPPPLQAPVRLNVPEGYIAVDLPGSSGSSSVTSAPASTATERTDIRGIDSVVTQVRSPARRRRRRRRTVSETSCCDETKRGNTSAPVTAEAASSQDWTQVGVNLRKIADDFYSSLGKVGGGESEASKRPCGVESTSGDAGLLSMLTPPAFGGSIWTAVIFLVGWRLLRAR